MVGPSVVLRVYLVPGAIHRGVRWTRWGDACFKHDATKFRAYTPS